VSETKTRPPRPTPIATPIAIPIPAEAQLSTTTPHRVSMPLIGRAPELDQLDAVFARAVEYRAPQLVTVVGAQGAGKTRLVAEWLARLLDRHRSDASTGVPVDLASTGVPVDAQAANPGRPRTYRGRAVAGAGSHSLIKRILRDRFGIVEADDAAARHEKVRAQLAGVFADKRMAEVIHFLGRYLDLPVEDNAFLRAISLSEDPRQEDRIARTVLRRFLELDAEHTPLVLAFDDLHLADDDSLTLLSELAEGLGGSPVLLVAAARPELFVRRADWGAGTLDHTRLELGPLSREETEQLLRGLLAPAEPLPKRLVEDACELTHGNPFFVEELVRIFHANGTVIVHGEKWRIDLGRAAQASLPMSIEEAIQARISSLSPLERDLMEKAASLGSVFWLGALVVLGRISMKEESFDFSIAERARIEAALEELIERDYLLRMPDSTVPGEAEYIFKHNLEHDLVLKLVPPERARRYYLAAAEWLDTRLPLAKRDHSGEQLELQATLFHKGGNHGRAAECFIAAAQKARERYANDAAAELYARGIDLLDAHELGARIDPLHDYGDVLQRAGRTREALEAFHKMLQAAWRLDYLAKAGAAHGRIGRVHRARGEYALAEQHLDRALALFRAAEDKRGVAAVEDDLGRIAFLRGQYTQALERHRRAFELRSALGEKRSLALSLHNLAMVHHASGQHAEAMQRFFEALALRREIGDRPGVVQSLEAVAAAWRDRGNVVRSLEVLGEALLLAREIGDRLEQAAILTRMGETLAQLGRDGEATEHLNQAWELALSSGDRLLQSEVARLLAEVYLALGELQHARQEAEHALELAEKVGSPPGVGMAHRVLGNVLARGGIGDDDKALADEHLQRSIEILGEVGNELELGRSYRTYAHVLSERGDVGGAAVLTERASEISDRLDIDDGAERAGPHGRAPEVDRR
jgi:predicted ATPase